MFLHPHLYSLSRDKNKSYLSVDICELSPQLTNVDFRKKSKIHLSILSWEKLEKKVRVNQARVYPVNIGLDVKFYPVLYPATLQAFLRGASRPSQNNHSNNSSLDRCWDVRKKKGRKKPMEERVRTLSTWLRFSPFLSLSLPSL